MRRLLIPCPGKHAVTDHQPSSCSPFGTRLTSICTATIASVDAGPTDVGDAHRKVSVRAARRPTFLRRGCRCAALGGTVKRAPAVCVSSSPTTSTPCSSSAPTILSQSTSSTRPCFFRPHDEDREADLEPPDVPCSQAWTRVRFRTAVGAIGCIILDLRSWMMPKGLRRR
jgi:hypothetical protein